MARADNARKIWLYETVELVKTGSKQVQIVCMRVSNMRNFNQLEIFYRKD